MSSTKTSSMDCGKAQAATPNFVLSLLAACSSSVPAAGQKGEATLSEQLFTILQDKAMSLDELNLLYSYRYGFSIHDALGFAGFNGKLLDYLDQQKRFSVHEGLVSVHTAPVGQDKEPDQDVTAASEGVAEEADDKLKPLAPSSQYVKNLDDETASNAETESTADAESFREDTDSDVDLDGWHSVGNRLVAALGSSLCNEGDVEGLPRKALSEHAATALSDSDAEDDLVGADVDAWYEVGSRIAAACKHGSADEDPIPDVAEWRSVGERVLRLVNDIDVQADQF